MRHCLDVMHIKKNVCENVIGTILNIPVKSKDGLTACKDFEKLGIRSELAPSKVEKGNTFSLIRVTNCLGMRKGLFTQLFMFLRCRRDIVPILEIEY